MIDQKRQAPLLGLLSAAAELAGVAQDAAHAAGVVEQAVAPIVDVEQGLAATGEALADMAKPMSGVHIEVNAPDIATPWNPSDAQRARIADDAA